jgi:hypothetical protein
MSTLTNHRTGGSRGANGYGEYQVRHASEKQQLFIKTLLETKEHSLGNIDTSSLNVQGAGEVITRLLALPNKAGVVIKASEKQLSYARSLIQNKEGGLPTLNHYLYNRKVNALDELDRRDVSAIIGHLQSAPLMPLAISITEVGAYLLDGTIYSIRKGTQSKKWQVWSYDKQFGKYLREPNKVKEDSILERVQPTDRLTLENAIKYSVQTGICCHCGRTLTVLKSVAGGIGPICAKRYN